MSCIRSPAPRPPLTEAPRVHWSLGERALPICRNADFPVGCRTSPIAHWRLAICLSPAVQRSPFSARCSRFNVPCPPPSRRAWLPYSTFNLVLLPPNPQSRRDCVTQPSVGPPGAKGAAVLRWETVGECPPTLNELHLLTRPRTPANRSPSRALEPRSASEPYQSAVSPTSKSAADHRPLPIGVWLYASPLRFSVRRSVLDVRGSMLRVRRPPDVLGLHIPPSTWCCCHLILNPEGIASLSPALDRRGQRGRRSSAGKSSENDPRV
jgi:hypothetical protein